MPRPKILDYKLIEKISKKLSISIKKVVKRVSAKASRLSISSEAALVLMAKELNIGTSTYQRKLDQHIQSQIRESLPIFFSKSKISSVKKTGSPKPKVNPKTSVSLAADYLLKDDILKERCKDLLSAKSSFDRPINQATLVLEDRIRNKVSPLPKKLVGIDLVNYAINRNLAKTVLKLSDDSSEQDGYANIFRGVVLTFRNPTHHQIIDSFSREDALRVCAFIDTLVRIIDNSIKIR